MISPTPDVYHDYHRPRDYQMDHVLESLIYANMSGVYTSLNLLSFPGFTDDEQEVERLISLIKKTGVKKVQFRNLNIDPEQFLTIIPQRELKPLGLRQMIKILKQEVPHLEIGNYSRTVGKSGEKSVDKWSSGQVDSEKKEQ
jgi:pyruvate-formate lyase-activating enzyme